MADVILPTEVCVLLNFDLGGGLQPGSPLFCVRVYYYSIRKEANDIQTGQLHVTSRILYIYIYIHLLIFI
jgi:hypothetical protein